MGISTHPVDSTIVISLWQGDICTGTFRLPAREAAGVISALAYGMTEVLSTSGESPEVPSSRVGAWWLPFFRRLFRRAPAEADAPLRLLK
jgi:hypothetical protein